MNGPTTDQLRDIYRHLPLVNGYWLQRLEAAKTLVEDRFEDGQGENFEILDAIFHEAYENLRLLHMYSHRALIQLPVRYTGVVSRAHIPYHLFWDSEVDETIHIQGAYHQDWRKNQSSAIDHNRDGNPFKEMECEPPDISDAWKQLKHDHPSIDPADILRNLKAAGE